jgi:ECF sigma factor
MSRPSTEDIVMQAGPPNDTPTPPGSVSKLIPPLKSGDHAAVQQLWERFFQPLVGVARQRLQAARLGPWDEEDVALEAFFSFCRQLALPGASERFPRLHDRTHLWRLLVCFTVREAFDRRRKEERRREIVRGESALGEAGFEPFADREPAPEFEAAVGDLLAVLANDDLRWLALRKMEGRTNAEIARERGAGWAVSTVERKLKVIRKLWKDHAPRGADDA